MIEMSSEEEEEINLEKGGKGTENVLIFVIENIEWILKGTSSKEIEMLKEKLKNMLLCLDTLKTDELKSYKNRLISLYEGLFNEKFLSND